ncbi:MAG: anaerobic carbon-monoxide dehydrogenase catalytic subunit [Actinobacteria bacterium]|nr:anaerobic carbon-monoxide dehydrogenase catalytic subunit [Actinomycetota bacterium]
MSDTEETKPKKTKEEPRAKSIDPAALQMIAKADAEGLSTVFSRVDEMKACPIGAAGSCCQLCAMGPCRLVGKNAEEKTGICGATHGTIGARYMVRSIAGGVAAHSDHGRDIARTLLAVSKGDVQGYEVKDTEKLNAVAALLNIPTEGREINDIAGEVAQRALDNFNGVVNDELDYVARAPKKRQEIWQKLGLVPRGVDREIVESMHRTHVGVDQDADHLLDQGMRTSLADGWGGAMLATDLSDILFGTPKPLVSEANLGVLKEEDVNIIVHGHEPTLSEMIVAAAQDPEVIEYARSKGAKGITLAGICCTANEVLQRHGIPPAGNFLHQELAIITGAVDAMIVDVQCVMQALQPLAEKFHTKLITTSPKAKIPNATHVEFDEEHALDIAKDIVRMGIDNYANRGVVEIPQYKDDMVAGFSHEYINYMLGGKYRASFRPLNDNIMNGKIQGAVAIVGCNNPRVTQDEGIIYLVKELIKNNILVVQTGCAAHASAKHGLLKPELLDEAGEGLREVCEAVGIPPVLHLGSCVDNSRIMTILAQVVEEGGLGEDISDLPVAAICPEYYCEKALAIGTYAAASGVYVVFGVRNPVADCTEVVDIMSNGWEKKVGGQLVFEPQKEKILEMVLNKIQEKREALGIHEEKERVLLDMAARREL